MDKETKDIINKLSTSELVDVVKHLRAMAVEFDKVETQEEADLMNKTDTLLGLCPDWKIGDKFIGIDQIMGNT